MIAVLIGGTGTLGKQVLPLLLSNPQIERVRILSRGEHIQVHWWEAMDASTRARVDFFVGDCRDRERMIKATKHAQVVFHLAAMKSVDKAEYDPWEAVQTNIMGTKNVMEACLENGVEKAIFTSTDKAVAPLNIYGASKLVAEKLWIQGNIGRHRTRFSVCRYGNVLGSQGSVLSKWKKAYEAKMPICITHEEMTRFFLLPKQAAEFVVTSVQQMTGGEVFVPKMKSTTLMNLARAFVELQGAALNPDDVNWMGIRPGEKMHECLISPDEVGLVTDDQSRFIRWPEKNLFPVQRRGLSIQFVPESLAQFGYTSFVAERFSMEELKELIQWQSLD